MENNKLDEMTEDLYGFFDVIRAASTLPEEDRILTPFVAAVRFRKDSMIGDIAIEFSEEVRAKRSREYLLDIFLSMLNDKISMQEIACDFFLATFTDEGDIEMVEYCFISPIPYKELLEDDDDPLTEDDLTEDNLRRLEGSFEFIHHDFTEIYSDFVMWRTQKILNGEDPNKLFPRRVMAVPEELKEQILGKGQK